ncbi:hypothetical protein PQ455_10535 [Sphingomonas naphthae]|uniref:LexA repressor DNA-binding domain-containing protein n=1 Tax=Sphingomonas naphthae TaxID=1813468 RepID=A0ABY7TI26_9SPHN|nr:hypothetical protein [Sphingomonas naphthae]WCT72085.1 hypothetical protein PQ455_10535 [Sphingomonas naphthae]
MTPHHVVALDYIRERIAEIGCAPTLDEIGARLTISKTNAHRIVELLIADGKLLRRGTGRNRDLALPDLPDLVAIPTAALRRELARRGVTLEALHRERPIASAYAPTCAVPRCGEPVESGHLMCRDHWYSVDRDHRNEIFRLHGIAKRSRLTADSNAYSDAVWRAATQAAERGRQ